MRGQRGFALIESLGTIAFASVALTAGAGVTYTAFAHQWLKHAAYESSICLSTSAPSSECESILRKTTRTALPIGHLEKVSVSRSRTSVKTELRWRLNSVVVLAFDDVRSIPLLGNHAR